MDKRKPNDELGNGSVVKRPKQGSSAVVASSKRTSTLQAPIVQMTGHTSEVLTLGFNPTGDVLASSGNDRGILLWRAFGDNQNYATIKGSKGAVLDLHWTKDGERIVAAGADATIGIWDAATGTSTRRHKGHESVVNAVDVMQRGMEISVSASDDRTIGLWDARQKAAIDYFECAYPQTSVAFDDIGSKVYAAGTEGTINTWDLRKREIVQVLHGHDDVVTSLSLSPDGQYLLSNGMDGVVRTWDVRPFGPEDRAMGSYQGAPPGLDMNLIKASWNRDGSRIAAGSGDQTVVVWDVVSKKILYKLPGHRGCVNDVRFAPYEPILASASSDRCILLGEIKPAGM